MSSEFSSTTSDYRQWLSELKGSFRQVQIKAAMAVNRELLHFYGCCVDFPVKSSI